MQSLDKSQTHGILDRDNVCTDSTLKLSRAEENLLKRMRQVGSGLFQVVVIESVPVLIVFGGKTESLVN
jgi:hypothetical protein